MQSFIIAAHIITAVSIVALVLIQQGRGGTGALGGGASDTFFGSRGSFSILAKLTAGLALFFFVTSLGLSIIARKQLGVGDIDPDVIRQQQEEREFDLPLPGFDENQEGQGTEEGQNNPSP